MTIALEPREGGKNSMSDVEILATGFGFPEGPVVCADGAVILTVNS